MLGKNWMKVDVTRELPIDTVLERRLTRTYSDYPAFKVRVESVEEIGAEKIRSLVERKKCRDYYDVWQLMKLKLRRDKLKRLLARKLQYKGIKIKGLEEVFPSDLSDILEGYWNRELGRLSYPVPELEDVLSELKNDLKPLIRPDHTLDE